jgi:hypothetical protein
MRLLVVPTAQPLHRYACVRQFAQFLLAPLPCFQVASGPLQFVSISRSAHQKNRPVEDFICAARSTGPALGLIVTRRSVVYGFSLLRRHINESPLKELTRSAVGSFPDRKKVGYVQLFGPS